MEQTDFIQMIRHRIAPIRYHSSDQLCQRRVTTSFGRVKWFLCRQIGAESRGGPRGNQSEAAIDAKEIASASLGSGLPWSPEGTGAIRYFPLYFCLHETSYTPGQYRRMVD
jgi:hypothetical protein